MSWLVVDAMNVIGSRPDGWWHDRRGAVDDLVDRVRDAAPRLDAGRITIVVDGRGDDVADDADPVEVVWAGSGRDAADDCIVSLLREADVTATVVTADRRLADRVAALSAGVVGPRSFRRTLEDAGL